MVYFHRIDVSQTMRSCIVSEEGRRLERAAQLRMKSLQEGTGAGFPYTAVKKRRQAGGSEE